MEISFSFTLDFILENHQQEKEKPKWNSTTILQLKNDLQRYTNPNNLHDGVMVTVNLTVNIESINVVSIKWRVPAFVIDDYATQRHNVILAGLYKNQLHMQKQLCLKNEYYYIKFLI